VRRYVDTILLAYFLISGLVVLALINSSWFNLALSDYLSWRIELILSVPLLLILNSSLGALYSLVLKKRRWLACNLIIIAGFSPLLSNETYVTSLDCPQSTRIVQFNLLYQNPNINTFINYVIQHPIDLIVLQEVAPPVGEKLKLLNDLYPYQYGGQPKVGYPSGQMILSRTPLVSANLIATSPRGDYIIKVDWVSPSGLPLHLMTAHPPSPRTQNLWKRRNQLLQRMTIESESYLNSDLLIVGDFNLSAISPRFKSLWPNEQTQPIASWPTRIKTLSIPAWGQLAIDHLWIRSSSWKICSRISAPENFGSDHKLIITTLSQQ
jgi:endonuclease/exonuclease/phosphatase (EEP) superfamily protein YafD